jgi:hypothetical protein
MQAVDRHQWSQRTPKKRPRHYAYDANLDEPAQLLRQEAVDVEEETPAEDSEPVERPDQDDVPPPAFEE